MNATRFQQLTQDLNSAGKRHRERFGDQVTDFTRKVSLELHFELEHLLGSFRTSGLSGNIHPDFPSFLKKYLLQMQWVVWGNCEFAPPLKIEGPIDEICPATLAYLSARLIDDSIDGHKTYKDQATTLYGRLTQSMRRARSAGTTSTAGNLLLTATIRRMVHKGYECSAVSVMRSYSNIFAGALAEGLCQGRTVSEDDYRAIVQHKAVAYDMLLHRVFFRSVDDPLRTSVLQFLAEHSELSQWLNDWCDELDDRARGQLNILNVPGITKSILIERIVERVSRLREKMSDLPDEIHDVMALRLLNTLEKFLQVECDDAYKDPFRRLWFGLES